MKILSIRFQNLNSLSGIWNIDFTAPPYAENSLFAITGPTGSGKSTLLDGLCLALYSATPRLGKITKTSNQIMSRHTGVCFAEVEFSTSKGRFRCHWSQHRSHQKAQGDLQQPKHEIVDATNDTVLESGIRRVASKVEEVTGMDFDRFTRSTLLAQGGFAAFLQASADNRSPILEQITGTAIYSRLSIKVHELWLLEQAKLEQCEQNLARIDLLLPEDEEHLQQQIAATEKESGFVRAQLTTLRSHLTWVESIAKLETEHNGYLKQLQTLAEDKKKHDTDLAPLLPALAAKEIEPLFLGLKQHLDSEKTALQERETLNKQCASHKEIKKDIESKIKHAEKSLLHTEALRKDGLKQIRIVQELDHTLSSAAKKLQEQINTLHTQQKALQNEYSVLQTLRQSLEQTQNNKQSLDTFFKRHARDGQLIEEFAAIQIVITRLNELYEQQSALTKTKEKTDRVLQSSEQALTEIIQRQRTLQTQTTACTGLSTQLQKTCSQLLQGADSSGLQQRLFKTENRQKNIRELILLLEHLSEQTSQLNTLTKQKASTTAQIQEGSIKLSAGNKEMAAKQQEIHLLEKNLLLLTRIQSLEEDRNQLRDDTPCPLCGSKKHPYNQGNIPQPSQEAKQLQQAKTELQAIEKDFALLTRQETIAKERIHSLTCQITEREEQSVVSRTTAEQLLSTLSLPPLAEIHLSQLQEEAEKISRTQKELCQDLEKLHKLNQELDTVKRQGEELSIATQTLEKELLSANHQKSSATIEQQRILRQEQDLSKDLVLLGNELARKLHPYGSFECSSRMLPQILDDLGLRVTKWRDRKEEEAHLNPKLIRLTSEHSLKEMFCAKESKQILAQETLCALTQKDVDELQRKRLTLFGNKKTEEEEARLEQSVTDARNTLLLFQKKYGTIDKEIAAFNTLQRRLEEEATVRSQAIAISQEAFNKSLHRSIFSSQEHFFDAILPLPKIVQLQELQNTLQERETELTTLCKDKATNLQLEKEKKLCKETAEELTKQVREREKQLETLQETSIGARERLKRNMTDKTQATEQRAALASQQKKTGSWKRLHTLIGSADGKKFRNFAQGLTFEMMVHHANRHLGKMNDRYILVRDKEHPLDLNVIDTYQADEIRSTKNLSGGESFLVSLALALGLAHMASRNVRVDSLFLDEGFGTLDENALESALETLAKLREENKLIGIISHVSALQERVPLQLKITPSPQGNSTISGPGVTHGIQ